MIIPLISCGRGQKAPEASAAKDYLSFAIVASIIAFAIYQVISAI